MDFVSCGCKIIFIHLSEKYQFCDELWNPFHHLQNLLRTLRV